MKTGDIGKIIRNYVPERILFRTKWLRNLYDRTPYRTFNGQDATNYFDAVEKDILVLKKDYPDLDLSNFRPVVVIEGYATFEHNGTIVGKYQTTIHFDLDKDTRTSIPRDILKSALEETFKKLPVKSIDEAVKYYDKR